MASYQEFIRQMMGSLGGGWRSGAQMRPYQPGRGINGIPRTQLQPRTAFRDNVIGVPGGGSGLMPRYPAPPMRDNVINLPGYGGGFPGYGGGNLTHPYFPPGNPMNGSTPLVPPLYSPGGGYSLFPQGMKRRY